MPTNKNALARYKILDELLSSRLQGYTVREMVEKCGQDVGARCIENDIKFLSGESDDSPFDVVGLERTKKEAPYGKNGDKRKVTAYKYAEPGYSIFHQKLTKGEQEAMKVLFNILGRFEGLPHFQQLENMRLSINKELNEEPIVLMAKNPLENNNIFAQLFSMISDKVTTRLTYHKFKDTEQKTAEVFPYLLHEYNRRWFLLCRHTETGKVLVFGLERLDKIEALPERQYEEFDEKWEDYFGDIIGVSNIDAKDEPVYSILLWADDTQKGYVETKPLHDSQTLIRSDSKERKEHPELKGGAFFRIKCRRNYELTRELCSYGSGLIVLSPDVVREDVKKWVDKMHEAYNK